MDDTTQTETPVLDPNTEVEVSATKQAYRPLSVLLQNPQPVRVRVEQSHMLELLNNEELCGIAVSVADQTDHYYGTVSFEGTLPVQGELLDLLEDKETAGAFPVARKVS